MKTERQSLERHGERLTVVERYIGQHMDERLDRDVLAALAGYSVPHFHRLFTAQAGEAIASYVRRARLRRAAQKLRVGAVDITEVALAAGYDTHAAFSKAFKRQFGLSPSEFRRLGFIAATDIIRKG